VPVWQTLWLQAWFCLVLQGRQALVAGSQPNWQGVMAPVWHRPFWQESAALTPVPEQAAAVPHDPVTFFGTQVSRQSNVPVWQAV